MEHTTARALAERFSVVFLDAYGVLVDGGGAVRGAAEFLAELRRTRRPYFVLTNDASRLPSTYVGRFGRYGLPFTETQILTSGSLLGPFFAREGLAGARCLVLGPPDSEAYVARAKGDVLARNRAQPEDVEVIVVGDDSGFPFLETLNFAVTAAIARIDRGRSIALVCPNPDRMYPRGDGAFGVAAGSIAHLIEGTLSVRFPDVDPPKFTFLGKPHAPLFDAACARADTRDAVMLGDQIETDIRGANRAGLAAALVSWGIAHAPSIHGASVDRPAFLIEGW